MNLKPAVLVTGAGSGIGAATAMYFSKMGHPVVLVGRRKSKLADTSKHLNTKNLILPTDLTKTEEILALAKAVEHHFPGLSILVNNAGIFEMESFEKSSDDLWIKMFETNLMGTVRLTRALTPILKNNSKGMGASVVNIASTAGLRPLSGMIAYSTLKAAVISFTQSLALEFASFNIRVNCVCPGIVETPMAGIENMDAVKLQTLRAYWAKIHPLGRAGKPEEIASGIYSFCHPGSQWMTGVILPVDGGISLT